MKIKTFRRIAQIATMAAIFIIPILNIYKINFIKGTFYSIDVGDVAIADPLAIFQAAMAAKHVNIYMIASLIIPLLLVGLLGRVWCSWFCPYYLMVEFLGWIRKKIGLKSIKPETTTALTEKNSKIRYLTLLIGLFITGIAGIPILNLISAPGIISSQALVFVKFRYVTFEIVFILVLLTLEFFFFYKFWCRLFCPTGIFLALFRWKKGMRVEKLIENCSMCKSCIKVCPAVINPMTEGSSQQCHNCGDCIDTCPDNKKQDTLKFKI